MGLEDIPLIGDIAGVAIHGAEAVGDAVTGDWDGAANQAQSMAGSAIGVATGGITTAVEDVYDELAPHAGLPSSHDLGHDALQGVGNALGDGAYNLVHGGDDTSGGGATDGGGLLDGGLGGGGLDGGLGGGDLGGGGGDMTPIDTTGWDTPDGNEPDYSGGGDMSGGDGSEY